MFLKIKNKEIELNKLIEDLKIKKEKIKNIIKNDYYFVEESENKWFLFRKKDHKKLAIYNNSKLWYMTPEFTFVNQKEWTQQDFLTICKIVELDFLGDFFNIQTEEELEEVIEYKIEDKGDFLKITDLETNEKELICKYYFPKKIEYALLVDIAIYYVFYSSVKN